MDSRNDEQTELLRNIWNQMKDLDRNLCGRIDALREDLGPRVSRLEVGLAEVKQEVAGVKQEVAGVKLELVGVKVELVALRSDVEDLKLEVKSIRVATQSGFELLTRADARQQRGYDELRERVDRVEEHVGLPPFKKRRD